MQARLSTPRSLAAHHRRLMASCAESGCPQVRQTSGSKLCARTVDESLCMSKSVEAQLQGPDSERQGPTNRMSAAMFSGSPHSTRAMMSDRTERHVTSEAADEATGTREPSAGRRVGCLAQDECSKPDPKDGDESQRKLHESLVRNSQDATQQRHGQQNRSGSTRRGDRCGHVGGLGRRTNLCAPLRFGLHRPGHQLAAC
jgi:hypothetical protein